MSRNSPQVPWREFSTPPPPQRSSRRISWKSAPSTPFQSSEKKNSSPQTLPPSRGPDSFHVVHKVPTGDSPYVKAKHVQLIDKDPSKAVSLFWSAINAGDRIDSALKDMAIVMKQLNRTDEAIEAIKSFRRLCSQQAQESLDNVLIDLYKRAGRIDEHVELLQYKLRLIEEGAAFKGKRTKIARSQGKKFHVSVDQERARLLGNLAWAYMQQNNFRTAEELYRRALSIEPDKNKQCNLAICLMNGGRITEARSLLEEARPSPAERETADSYIKSFDRALETLSELEDKVSSIGDNQSQAFGSPNCRKRNDRHIEVPEYSNHSTVKQVRTSYSPNESDCSTDYFGFSKKGRWGLEQRSGIPVSPQPVTADKSRKVVAPRSNSLLEERYHSSNSKNVNESRTEGGGFSSRNMSTDGNILDSPVSVHRSSKFKSAKTNCNSESVSQDWRRTDGNILNSPVTVQRSSQHKSTKPDCTSESVSQDWRRRPPWDFKNEAEDIHGCIKSHIQTPMTVDCSGTMERQKLGESVRPSSRHGRDQRPNLMVSESVNENVIESTGGEAHSVTKDSNTKGNSTTAKKSPYFKSGKSWADMAEEEEDDDDDLLFWECTEYLSQQSSSASFRTPSEESVNGPYGYGETFQDENVDSNIIRLSPRPPISSSRLTSQARPFPQRDLTDTVSQKFQRIDLEGGKYDRSADNSSIRSSTTRRVLSFDQKEHKEAPAPAGSYCPPMRRKAFDFNEYSCEPIRRGNRRLQVFRDITPDSPRA